jgi:hypothetical protein
MGFVGLGGGEVGESWANHSFDFNKKVQGLFYVLSFWFHFLVWDTCIRNIPILHGGETAAQAEFFKVREPQISSNQPKLITCLAEQNS